MPNNKRQHYVPQFYLRNFGVGNSIGLFNLRRRKHFPDASIPGQCQRDYLYGRDGIVEAELRELERGASRAIDDIISTSALPALGSPGYESIIEFISFQLGRTPEAALAAHATEKKLRSAFSQTRQLIINESTADPQEPSYRKEAGLRSIERSLTGSLRISAETTPLLYDLTQLLLTNSSRVPFLTSDWPVVLFNPWCAGWTASGVTGLASAGLVVFFPLSPSHTLILADSNVYALPKQSKLSMAVDDRDIKGLNALRLLGAHSNIYYSQSPEAVAAVDELPFHWHHRRVDTAIVRVHQSPEDGSYLIQNYQRQPDVRVHLRFLRVKATMRSIQLRERANAWRPRAMAIERSLSGDRDHMDRRPSLETRRTWRPKFDL